MPFVIFFLCGYNNLWKTEMPFLGFHLYSTVLQWNLSRTTYILSKKFRVLHERRSLVRESNNNYVKWMNGKIASVFHEWWSLVGTLWREVWLYQNHNFNNPPVQLRKYLEWPQPLSILDLGYHVVTTAHVTPLCSWPWHSVTPWSHRTCCRRSGDRRGPVSGAVETLGWLCHWGLQDSNSLCTSNDLEETIYAYLIVIVTQIRVKKFQKYMYAYVYLF